MNTSRTFNGTVVSVTTNKTCIVEVVRTVIHPLYHKRLKRTRRYPVHDERGVITTIGQAVSFEECRPLSKTKRWKLVSVEKERK